jgi:hypothetical protein
MLNNFFRTLKSSIGIGVFVAVLATIAYKHFFDIAVPENMIVGFFACAALPLFFMMLGRD